MGKVSSDHRTILCDYHDTLYRTPTSINENLIGEIENFVLAHRNTWSFSDLPVLISLSNRVKQLTPPGSSIHEAMDTVLIIKDTPTAERARQALYQLLLKILNQKIYRYPWMVSQAVDRLWGIVKLSHEILRSRETRAIIHSLTSEISELKTSIDSCKATLENNPPLVLQLNEETREDFRKSLLNFIRDDTQNKLNAICDDPLLTEKEKYRAMEACEAQADQKLERLDKDLVECVELLEDCFQLAGASDKAFSDLDLDAKKAIFDRTMKVVTTIEEKYPFLNRPPYYPKLMERIKIPLQTLEANWNPFSLLTQTEALDKIGCYLDQVDFFNWVLSHKFLYHYFPRALLFCENIDRGISSKDYVEALDLQNALLERISVQSRGTWASHLGKRIQGLSLKKNSSQKVNLDQLLKKCSNLVALDLRGAVISSSDIPTNLPQLKFIAFPPNFPFSPQFLAFLKNWGLVPTTENPQFFMRAPVKIQNNILTIDAGNVFSKESIEFNPSYLLTPSLEKLILKGNWNSSKLSLFFSQLKTCCPKLQFLDARETHNCLKHLFHIDLSALQKIAFSKSTDQELRDFFTLLELYGFMQVSQSRRLRGDQECYTWEKTEYVFPNILTFTNESKFPEQHYVIFSQLYPKLTKLTLNNRFEKDVPSTVWNLITPTTAVELWPSTPRRSHFENELAELGFESRYDSRKNKLVWENPRACFTLRTLNLAKFDEILARSPKNFVTQIGLLFLKASPQSFEDICQLKRLLQKYEVESLRIGRLDIDTQFIKELLLLIAVGPQVTFSEIRLNSVPESGEYADLVRLLGEHKVEKLKLPENATEHNQFLKILFDLYEQFPSLVSIEGQFEGKVPESWILRGWLPNIQKKCCLVSRRPTRVTLSAEVAEILTEEVLLQLPNDSQVQSIDLTGQPISEQLAKKLLHRHAGKLTFSSDLEDRLIFERNIIKTMEEEKSLPVRSFKMDALPDKSIVLADSDIVTLADQFPNLEYLYLEDADLSQITSKGIKALLKLSSLKFLSIGACSLLLINTLINSNTLTTLRLSTKKLFQMDLNQFSSRVYAKKHGKIDLELTAFHPICLQLLKHPFVNSIIFRETKGMTQTDKSAITALGFKRQFSLSLGYVRIDHKAKTQYLFTNRERSFILKESDLSAVGLIWFSLYYPSIQSLVYSGRDLNDQGLHLLPRMKCLTLKNTPSITFEGLIAYLRRGTSLHTLQLHWNISPEQMAQLQVLGWRMTSRNRMYKEFERVSSEATDGLIRFNH